MYMLFKDIHLQRAACSGPTFCNGPFANCKKLLAQVLPVVMDHLQIVTQLLAQDLSFVVFTKFQIAILLA